MAFSPTITACTKNSCTTLSITDTTGVYDATDNPKGWQDASTLLAADVTKVEILITYPNGTTQTVDADISDIPDPVTGQFTYADIQMVGYTDGLIEIEYIVYDNTAPDPVSYSYTYEALFTCQTRACVDKMWAEVACKSCSGNCELTSLIDDANLAEGLLRGLESGAVCCDETCINKILAAINQLCNWNNCNC